jgi:ferredoxin
MVNIVLPSGKVTTVDPNLDLRTALKEHWDEIYHPVAKRIHCRGLGTCGTCAIKIKGMVTPPTGVENWRLGFPPHSLENDLRLACQVRPLGDLEIRKAPGFWGHKVAK